MKTINRILVLTSVIFLSYFLNSCEDKPPVDYTVEKYLEAYLIVDKPIEKIILMNSQPIDKKYSKDQAMIKDAEVKILSDNQEYILSYKDGENAGYYLPDASVTVKPETVYKIEIMTKDGVFLTAETKTPKRINAWVKAPKSEIYYPQDTLNLPKVDSLEIEWTPVEGTSFFLIRTLCQDTLNYGKYLPVPTNEANRRCYNLFSKNENAEPMYKNPTNWGLIANNKTATVWLAFRWFGLHDVSVFNPDPNMLNWFINIYFTGSSETNPLLNSVKGGFGVFGSASVLSYESFLYKNQP